MLNKNFSIFRSLIFLSFVLCSEFSSAELIGGTVSSVNDGDTITLQTLADTKKIRLVGIDAPELKQPYGTESRDALRQDLLNQTVTVDIGKKDKYGRSVGKVLLNGEDVNLKQVNRGLAWLYVKYLPELAAEDRIQYKSAQEAAQQDKLGLWGQDAPEEPWNFRNKRLERATK